MNTIKNKKNSIYKIPQNIFNIADYLNGYWKRTLTCRNFGDAFDILRSENSVIRIETLKMGEDPNNSKRLKWSFGKNFSEEELQFGYIILCKKETEQEIISFEWQYSGN